MITVNIHEAKTHLSRLIESAAAGDTAIIAKAGKPLVKLTKLDAAAAGAKSRIGFMQGQVSIPDDIDTIFEDEIAQLFDIK
jgi:prevent-host-death family protein